MNRSLKPPFISTLFILFLASVFPLFAQEKDGVTPPAFSQSPYHVGLHGNRVLFALAELVIGWRLAVGARVALGKRESATATSLDPSAWLKTRARFGPQ